MKARVLSCILGGLCSALIGCGQPDPIKRGDGNGNTGASSSGAQPSLGGNLGMGAQPSLGGDTNGTGAEPGEGCQTGGAEFVPKVPTVLLMVDRSGTMFKDAGMEPWTTLRDGVLEVVQAMAKDVRFGLVAITGEGGMCPLIDEVTPAESNYDALSAKYMSLGAPLKGESPGMRGLERAGEILAADTSPGDKYILFVTDGEQDFCNDGFYACPTDSVVARLQGLAAQGFKTFIFGLPMASMVPEEQARYPVVLQAFADAGSGLPTVGVMPTPADTFYGCQGDANWAAEHLAAGKAMMDAIGTYSTVSGGAPVFKPDPTDKEKLKEEFAKVLSGVKSCTFDIGGDIKIIQNLLSEAHVYVEGQEVPLDLTMTNGWYMPTEQQIELVGEACTNWRTPGNNVITWDFPCKIIVPK
jgi:hypothetical protein